MTLQDDRAIDRERPASADPTAGSADSHSARAPMLKAYAQPSISVPWHQSYRRWVLFADAIVLGSAVTLASIVRFGAESAMPAGLTVTYSALGLVIAAVWWVFLQVYGATDARHLGDGPEEYRRVVHASVTTFGVLAIVTLLTKQDLSRGYLAIAFPVGLAALLLVRKSLRTRLSRLRAAGEMTTNVLVVGGRRSAMDMHREFARHASAGMRVTGVWVPDEHQPANAWLRETDRFVPIMGSEDSLDEALSVAEAGMVVVSDSEHLGHGGLKNLTWDLQARDVDLMVCPNVVDVSAPRLTLRTVGSMPFVHLEKPQYEGATRWGKVVFDKIFALAAIVALSPVFVAAALAVKLSSPGPVLYRSERIGVGGAPFEMLKFRSMVDGADRVKSELAADQDGVLFKMRDDPRVTRVGAFLRRYSIDELPQFFNVLRGEMSVVGPRPPLRSEVARYDLGVDRRLLVKQGLTGLWQVSGRSDLSWDDTVRLDLDYVENWSLTRDVRIIWRTLRAVSRSRGAY